MTGLTRKKTSSFDRIFKLLKHRMLSMEQDINGNSSGWTVLNRILWKATSLLLVKNLDVIWVILCKVFLLQSSNYEHDCNFLVDNSSNENQKYLKSTMEDQKVSHVITCQGILWRKIQIQNYLPWRIISFFFFLLI